MNIQDKTIELLLEARSHSTAKINGVENQKYGRDNKGVPDVIIAAQDIWQQYVDNIYYVNSDIGALCALGYDIIENTEGIVDCTLGELKDDRVYGITTAGAYDLLVSFARVNGDSTSDDTLVRDVLSEEDIKNYVTNDVNNILAEKKIPVSLTICYDFYDGLEITGVTYTGNDSSVNTFIEKTDHEELMDMIAYEGDIPRNRWDRRDNLRNRDSLSKNKNDHRTIMYDNERRAELDKKAADLKTKLSRTKNYAKASQLQSELDNIEGRIADNIESRTSTINDIKNRMKNHKGDVK